MSCIKYIKAENPKHPRYPPTDTQNEEAINASRALIEVGISLRYEGPDDGDASRGTDGIAQGSVTEDFGIVEPIYSSGNVMVADISNGLLLFQASFGGSKGTMVECCIILRQRRDKREEVLPP